MITSLRVKACEHERVPAGLAWLAFLEINSMLTWYRMSSAFFRREDRLAAPPATGLRLSAGEMLLEFFGLLTGESGLHGGYFGGLAFERNGGEGS